MNLLFLVHNVIDSNSGNHVRQIADRLAGFGHDIVVAVPDGLPATPPASARFGMLSFSEAADARFADGGGIDLIHAWTPRQHVARAARRASDRHGCPYVVHLEDNEHAVTAAFLGLEVEEMLARAAAGVLEVPDNLAHPADMRRFLDRAAGMTVLIDRLLEFAAPGQKGVEFWPAAEDDLFTPRNPSADVRRVLGIPDGARVLVYHGNVHPANFDEVRSLYTALEALIRAGMDLFLVRLGTDTADLAADLPNLRPRLIPVPFRPRSALPEHLALADVFVQPGRENPFNDYRFPSKLPEFFAMGRPVILPASNIGRYVEDGENAIVLKEGSALEMAGAIQRVLGDAALAERLSRGARRFYEQKLSWSQAAEKVNSLYGSIDRGPRLGRLDDAATLGQVAHHYADYRVPEPLSYATVRDFCDSVDRLPAVSTLNRDLKDAQRPWVMKAILGMVPRGSRLLEIGAGDPWVADLLDRLGYEVHVVDPYDGRDRGPAEYEAIRRQYPRITFHRGLFPSALGSAHVAFFDCIYSISVLEHLPLNAIDVVAAGIRSHSRSLSAPTIHAVDHVLLGRGDASHRTSLDRLASSLGFGPNAVETLLSRLSADPDAYFLSAEAHNMWRGKVAYDDFPMRRCVSIQICCPAGGPQAGRP